MFIHCPEHVAKNRLRLVSGHVNDPVSEWLLQGKFKFKRFVMYLIRLAGVNISKHGTTDSATENKFNIG
jgi:hypothetical protein